MIKIAIVVCLAALTAAEADADAFYGPYGYSNYGSNSGYNWNNWWNNWNNNNWNNNWNGNWNNMYGYNFPMMSGYRQMNYNNYQQGQSYGKRSADAEADADVWDNHYTDSVCTWPDCPYNMNYMSNWNRNNMYNRNNWNNMNNMYNMNYMNNWNRPYFF